MKHLSEEQRTFAAAFASGLLEFTKAFGRGTFADVIFWSEEPEHERYSRLDVALLGDPRKVSTLFGYDRPGEDVGLRGNWLSYQLSRALSISGETGFEYERVVSFPDFLQRLEGQTVYQFERESREFPFTEARVTFIPEPGYPWPDDFERTEPIEYWSARKKRLLKAERPAWLIEVESEGGRTEGTGSEVGVNPCIVFPADETKTNPHGPTVGDLGGEPLLVTHSFSLLESDKESGFHKQIDNAIAGIRACGGLLFPSLAVGPIPASNFGPVTLVARLELVLAALKPYRQRGRNPAWVYATDAWTETTGQLMRFVARRLFREMHGHEDWIYGRHMWILGPPEEALGATHDYDVKALDSTKQLERAIRKRMKRFKKQLSHAEFARLHQEATGFDKYPYCEAKAREVVALDEFPYLLAPETLGAPVKRFVDGVGYNGRVVYLPDEFGVADMEAPDREHRLYRWSWLLADACRRLEDPVRVQMG